MLYRLAPEHPFPAAVEDAVAVYKELLRSYKPIHIGIFGTSAGAMLAAETSGEAESARPPAARSPGHLQQHGRLRPSHRFGSDVLRWWFIRAFLRAGVDARLVVFDALPNAFWYDPTLPESIEATHIMADFLMKPVNK